MNARPFAVAAIAAALSGCFTLHESEMPEVKLSALPAELNLGVQMAGFETTVTTYVPVYGYGTVLGPVCGGRRHRHLAATTYATETYVPQTSRSTEYLDRASEAFARAGFTLQTAAPAYRVEVKFDGPFIDDSDSLTSAACTLFSLFTADYAVQTWTAKLNITDLKTGRLVFFHDYTERQLAVVWGPIPIFSPAGSGKTGFSAIQARCLAALTDRATADATAFLAGKAK
jgi:hypothetical protein